MIPSTRDRFTAWVVFQGSDHRRFYRIFTRRGYRHCWIILPVYYPNQSLNAERYSMVINPKTNYTFADFVARQPEDLIEELKSNGVKTIIKYSADSNTFRNYAKRPLFSCVEVVKSFLGISNIFVLTPYQLARWLVRHNGKLL